MQSHFKTFLSKLHIGRDCARIGREDIELGFRLFNSCVPLTNYNHLPYKCNVLDRSKLIPQHSIIDNKLSKNKNIGLPKGNDVYETLLSGSRKPEKFQYNDEAQINNQYNEMLVVLIEKKLGIDALGWFNYYKKPNSFTYSKILSVLYKLNPDLCLELYLKRQNELLPGRDIYLDNIGLKCYLLSGQIQQAELLFNRIHKDDCSFAFMMNYNINNDECHQLFKGFKDSGLVMSVGSVAIFSQYLLSLNKVDELISLLRSSAAKFETKFGLILSIAVLAAIRNSKKCHGAQSRLIESFDGLKYKEVRSVVDFNSDASSNLLSASGFKGSNINNSLSKLLNDEFSNVYIDHSYNVNWKSISSYVSEIDLSTEIDPVTIHICLTIISDKILISREVDAEIITSKLLDIPLSDQLQSKLDSDPFLFKMFNLPFLSLTNFDTLMRNYSKIGIYDPSLSNVNQVMNKFNTPIRLRIWILEHWFRNHKRATYSDFSILSKNIELILKSNRSELWDKQYRKLFSTYLKKKSMRSLDKHILLKLMMNFTELRTEELHNVMRRFIIIDPTFVVELYENFSPLANGTPNIKNATMLTYWRCLSSAALYDAITCGLNEIINCKIEQRYIHELTLILDKLSDGPIYQYLCKWILERTRSSNDGKPLSSIQTYFIQSVPIGVQMIKNGK